MKKYRRTIILLNLLIVFGLFTRSIFQKETTLSNGQLILLELAPVDPRSLIQGDYMSLNYAIAEDIDKNTIPKRGYCIVKLEENGIAHRIRIQANKTPLYENEYLIAYTSRKWQGINIGAESFFFQEGEVEKYEKAQYGGIKVDQDGNSLLIGLYDQYRNKIE